MDIKTENRKWKAAGRFPSEILFLTGFLTGTILPNMIWKMEWKQKTLASFYLIRNFAQKDTATERRVLFTAASVRFYSVRVPLSVVYMLILGLETGMVLAMSVLEFGLYGGLAGAALLLPQYLIYVPVYFWLAGLVYRQSFGIWKNYGLFPAKNLPYLKQVITAFGVYTGGIMAECFLNPWLVEKIIKYLKFF